VGDNHSPIDEHASVVRYPAATDSLASANPLSWHQGMRLEAVANLAHELRTPVQVLLGYIDILREDYGEQFSSEPRALLDRMNANVHDLAQTIDNLMHFVLSEVNAEAMVDEDITPGSLIAEITPVLEAFNQHKHLKLEFDFAETPDLFRVARRALKSILLNLAINAIKFTDSGSVTRSTRCATACSAPRSRSKLAIPDRALIRRCSITRPSRSRNCPTAARAGIGDSGSAWPLFNAASKRSAASWNFDHTMVRVRLFW